MFNFKVLEINSPEWTDIIKSSFIYDFHHTSFYHQLDNNHVSKLFVVDDGINFIGLPLVIRPIEDTNFYDATSVYGYAGPISNNKAIAGLKELTSFFWENFEKFCADYEIISVFTRLHPLIDQKDFFSGIGEILDLNKTVAIDLKLTLEEQKKQYRKSNKSELNQLRKKGFTVQKAETDEDIDRFIEIYYETMDRVEAKSYYYFSKEYFYNFLNNGSFGNNLLLAKFQDEIVAGAIFTTTDKIMQYHLAGTTEEYIRSTPMKLILDEARLLGKELGLEYLHLGGGVGGSDEDSLFKFKSGFSDFNFQFSIWKYIVNIDIYNDLVDKKGLSDDRSNFFPLYRM